MRVVDVGAIGDMRADSGASAGGGQFVAHISDPLCPWNEGAWRFAAEGGRLRVSRVEDRGGGAVVELTIQGLTALVFGSHDPADFVYCGWGAPAPAALTAMRTLFPAALPYLFETF